jgi:LiaF transmembrane domain
MMSIKRNLGALIAGSILIVFGLLALLGNLLSGFNFWGTLWPIIIIAFGGLFFVGMFAGGKSTAGLAIPGSIIGGLGLMMLIQNLTNYWASWAYSWTVILILVGVGIFIMGIYTSDPYRRQSGLRVMRVGAILFIIFGGFFELIFSALRLNGAGAYIFPALLILLGLYLLVSRSGLLGKKAEEANNQPVNPSEENK